jgi:L-threonylcarbamoyladenylate synthase
MKIFSSEKCNFEEIGSEIKKGKIVAFPTDTVYGLGAHIQDEKAITRIFRVKDRPLDSPIIVLIDDIKRVEEHAYIENPLVWDLMSAFWPGALTLILPKKSHINNLITANGDSLGLRIPDNDIARELIKNCGGALATPSANKSGQLSPTRAEHVIKQFEENEIDFIIDGGKTKKSIESTILDMTYNPPLIVRNGGITKEAIEEIIGSVNELQEKKKSKNSFSKEIKIIDKKEFSNLPKNSILLSFGEVKDLNIKKVEILSKNLDYNEAIENLYDSLYRLLDEDSPILYVEKLDENGLGKTIMERIKKIVK